MSDFTKKWRVTHDEPLNYNERIINSACDIIEQQEKRIKELGTEIQEVSNQLLELYTDYNEITGPKVFGTILGLHERLEKFKPHT